MQALMDSAALTVSSECILCKRLCYALSCSLRVPVAVSAKQMQEQISANS